MAWWYDNHTKMWRSLVIILFASFGVVLGAVYADFNSFPKVYSTKNEVLILKSDINVDINRIEDGINRLRREQNDNIKELSHKIDNMINIMLDKKNKG